MATITSAGTGNWGTGGTWVGGVKPAAGDDAVVDASHTVTVNETAYCKTLTGKGSVIMNADIVYDDAAGAGLTIEDSGGWTSNGTGSSPRVMRSASAVPTNPFTVRIEDVVGYDGRTITLNFIEFRGLKYYLGNDYYALDFNGGGATDPVVWDIKPVVRSPRIEEHDILGRTHNRISHRSMSAGVLTFMVAVHQDTYLYITLKNMVSSYQKFAFISHRHHLPSCRIERIGEPRVKGCWIEFSVSLREDS